MCIRDSSTLLPLHLTSSRSTRLHHIVDLHHHHRHHHVFDTTHSTSTSRSPRRTVVPVPAASSASAPRRPRLRRAATTRPRTTRSKPLRPPTQRPLFGRGGSSVCCSMAEGGGVGALANSRGRPREEYHLSLASLLWPRVDVVRERGAAGEPCGTAGDRAPRRLEARKARPAAQSQPDLERREAAVACLRAAHAPTRDICQSSLALFSEHCRVIGVVASEWPPRSLPSR